MEQCRSVGCRNGAFHGRGEGWWEGWARAELRLFFAPWEWAGGRMEGRRSVPDECECSAALPGEQTHAAEAKEKAEIKKT